jgi:hypothetical protein
MGQGVFGVEIGRPGKELQRELDVVAPVAIEEAPALQVVIVGLDMARGDFGEGAPLLGAEGDPQGPDDIAGDLLLDGEDVAELTVVGFRPEVVAAGGVDELDGDPQAVVGLADAALEDAVDAQPVADLAEVGRRPLNWNDPVREATRSPWMRQRALMISSAMPSQK